MFRAAQPTASRAIKRNGRSCTACARSVDGGSGERFQCLVGSFRRCRFRGVRLTRGCSRRAPPAAERPVVGQPEGDRVEKTTDCNRRDSRRPDRSRTRTGAHCGRSNGKVRILRHDGRGLFRRRGESRLGAQLPTGGRVPDCRGSRSGYERALLSCESSGWPCTRDRETARCRGFLQIGEEAAPSHPVDHLAPVMPIRSTQGDGRCATLAPICAEQC
jgi:hypothetical protein